VIPLVIVFCMYLCALFFGGDLLPWSKRKGIRASHCVKGKQKMATDSSSFRRVAAERREKFSLHPASYTYILIKYNSRSYLTLIYYARLFKYFHFHPAMEKLSRVYVGKFFAFLLLYARAASLSRMAWREAKA
jgi:hypothetical protein